MSVTVGQQVTVQFGNPTDCGWRAELMTEVPCTVQAIKFGIRRDQYLVKRNDNPNYIGAATINHEPESISGELYCTNTRTVGGCLWTKEHAVSSLGF